MPTHIKRSKTDDDTFQDDVWDAMMKESMKPEDMQGVEYNVERRESKGVTVSKLVWQSSTKMVNKQMSPHSSVSSSPDSPTKRTRFVWQTSTEEEITEVKEIIEVIEDAESVHARMSRQRHDSEGGMIEVKEQRVRMDSVEEEMEDVSNESKSNESSLVVNVSSKPDPGEIGVSLLRGTSMTDRRESEIRQSASKIVLSASESHRLQRQHSAALEERSNTDNSFYVTEEEGHEDVKTNNQVTEPHVHSHEITSVEFEVPEGKNEGSISFMRGESMTDHTESEIRQYASQIIMSSSQTLLLEQQQNEFSTDSNTANTSGNLATDGQADLEGQSSDMQDVKAHDEDMDIEQSPDSSDGVVKRKGKGSFRRSGSWLREWKDKRNSSEKYTLSFDWQKESVDLEEYNENKDEWMKDWESDSETETKVTAETTIAVQNISGTAQIDEEIAPVSKSLEEGIESTDDSVVVLRRKRTVEDSEDNEMKRKSDEWTRKFEEEEHRNFDRQAQKSAQRISANFNWQLSLIEETGDDARAIENTDIDSTEIVQTKDETEFYETNLDEVLEVVDASTVSTVPKREPASANIYTDVVEPREKDYVRDMESPDIDSTEIVHTKDETEFYETNLDEVLEVVDASTVSSLPRRESANIYTDVMDPREKDYDFEIPMDEFSEEADLALESGSDWVTDESEDGGENAAEQNQAAYNPDDIPQRLRKSSESSSSSSTSSKSQEGAPNMLMYGKGTGEQPTVSRELEEGGGILETNIDDLSDVDMQEVNQLGERKESVTSSSSGSSIDSQTILTEYSDNVILPTGKHSNRSSSSTSSNDSQDAESNKNVSTTGFEIATPTNIQQESYDYQGFLETNIDDGSDKEKDVAVTSRDMKLLPGSKERRASTSSSSFSSIEGDQRNSQSAAIEFSLETHQVQGDNLPAENTSSEAFDPFSEEMDMALEGVGDEEFLEMERGVEDELQTQTQTISMTLKDSIETKRDRSNSDGSDSSSFESAESDDIQNSDLQKGITETRTNLDFTEVKESEETSVVIGGGLGGEDVSVSRQQPLPGKDVHIDESDMMSDPQEDDSLYLRERRGSEQSSSSSSTSYTSDSNESDDQLTNIEDIEALQNVRDPEIFDKVTDTMNIQEKGFGSTDSLDELLEMQQVPIRVESGANDQITEEDLDELLKEPERQKAKEDSMDEEFGSSDSLDDILEKQPVPNVVWSDSNDQITEKDLDRLLEQPDTSKVNQETVDLEDSDNVIVPVVADSTMAMRIITEHSVTPGKQTDYIDKIITSETQTKFYTEALDPYDKELNDENPIIPQPENTTTTITSELNITSEDNNIGNEVIVLKSENELFANPPEGDINRQESDNSGKWLDEWMGQEEDGKPWTTFYSTDPNIKEDTIFEQPQPLTLDKEATARQDTDVEREVAGDIKEVVTQEPAPLDSKKVILPPEGWFHSMEDEMDYAEDDTRDIDLLDDDEEVVGADHWRELDEWDEYQIRSILPRPRNLSDIKESTYEESSESETEKNIPEDNLFSNDRKEDIAQEKSARQDISSENSSGSESKTTALESFPTKNIDDILVLDSGTGVTLDSFSEDVDMALEKFSGSSSSKSNLSQGHGEDEDEEMKPYFSEDIIQSESAVDVHGQKRGAGEMLEDQDLQIKGEKKKKEELQTLSTQATWEEEATDFSMQEDLSLKGTNKIETDEKRDSIDTSKESIEKKPQGLAATAVYSDISDDEKDPTADTSPLYAADTKNIFMDQKPLLQEGILDTNFSYHEPVAEASASDSYYNYSTYDYNADQWSTNVTNEKDNQHSDDEIQQITIGNRNEEDRFRADAWLQKCMDELPENEKENKNVDCAVKAVVSQFDEMDQKVTDSGQSQEDDTNYNKITQRMDSISDIYGVDLPQRQERKLSKSELDEVEEVVRRDRIEKKTQAWDELDALIRDQELPNQPTEYDIEVNDTKGWKTFVNINGKGDEQTLKKNESDGISDMNISGRNRIDYNRYISGEDVIWDRQREKDQQIAKGEVEMYEAERLAKESGYDSLQQVETQDFHDGMKPETSKKGARLERSNTVTSQDEYLSEEVSTWGAMDQWNELKNDRGTNARTFSRTSVEKYEVSQPGEMHEHQDMAVIEKERHLQDEPNAALHSSSVLKASDESRWDALDRWEDHNKTLSTTASIAISDNKHADEVTGKSCIEDEHRTEKFAEHSNNFEMSRVTGLDVTISSSAEFQEEHKQAQDDKSLISSDSMRQDHTILAKQAVFAETGLTASAGLSSDEVNFEVFNQQSDEVTQVENYEQSWTDVAREHKLSIDDFHMLDDSHKQAKEQTLEKPKKPERPHLDDLNTMQMSIEEFIDNKPLQRSDSVSSSSSSSSNSSFEKIPEEKMERVTKKLERSLTELSAMVEPEEGGETTDSKYDTVKSVEMDIRRSESISSNVSSGVEQKDVERLEEVPEFQVHSQRAHIGSSEGKITEQVLQYEEPREAQLSASTESNEILDYQHASIEHKTTPLLQDHSSTDTDGVTLPLQMRQNQDVTDDMGQTENYSKVQILLSNESGEMIDNIKVHETSDERLRTFSISSSDDSDLENVPESTRTWMSEMKSEMELPPAKPPRLGWQEEGYRDSIEHELSLLPQTPRSSWFDQGSLESDEVENPPKTHLDWLNQTSGGSIDSATADALINPKQLLTVISMENVDTKIEPIDDMDEDHTDSEDSDIEMGEDFRGPMNRKDNAGNDSDSSSSSDSEPKKALEESDAMSLEDILEEDEAEGNMLHEDQIEKPVQLKKKNVRWSEDLAECKDSSEEETEQDAALLTEDDLVAQLKQAKQELYELEGGEGDVFQTSGINEESERHNEEESVNGGQRSTEELEAILKDLEDTEAIDLSTQNAGQDNSEVSVERGMVETQLTQHDYANRTELLSSENVQDTERKVCSVDIHVDVMKESTTINTETSQQTILKTSLQQEIEKKPLEDNGQAGNVTTQEVDSSATETEHTGPLTPKKDFAVEAELSVNKDIELQKYEDQELMTQEEKIENKRNSSFEHIELDTASGTAVLSGESKDQPKATPVDMTNGGEKKEDTPSKEKDEQNENKKGVVSYDSSDDEDGAPDGATGPARKRPPPRRRGGAWSIFRKMCPCACI